MPRSIANRRPTKNRQNRLWRNLGGDHPQATEDGRSVGTEREKSKSLRKWGDFPRRRRNQTASAPIQETLVERALGPWAAGSRRQSDSLRRQRLHVGQTPTEPGLDLALRRHACGC